MTKRMMRMTTAAEKRRFNRYQRRMFKFVWSKDMTVQYLFERHGKRSKHTGWKLYATTVCDNYIEVTTVRVTVGIRHSEVEGMIKLIRS